MCPSWQPVYLDLLPVCEPSPAASGNYQTTSWPPLPIQPAAAAGRCAAPCFRTTAALDGSLPTATSNPGFPFCPGVRPVCALSPLDSNMIRLSNETLDGVVLL